MKSYLAFPILLLFFLQSCDEENTPLNHLEFYWEQTGCSDPWNTNSNNSDEETQRAVGDYLKEEGVRGVKVTNITNDGVRADCFACSCTTGKLINVTVPITEKSRMLALGFQETN